MRSYNLPFKYPIKISIILFFIILLFSTQDIYAQSGWQWQNPLPQGNDLTNVKFVNSRIGYAVGKSNTVLKTTNGGLNWNICNINFNYSVWIELLSVPDSNNIVCKGFYSLGTNNPRIIFKSTNGGSNWAVLSNPSSSEIQGLYFLNANTGFACSGNIYKTTNGGVNWIVCYSTFVSYSEIKFINENTGFIAGAGSILRTSNQGATWETSYNTLPSIFFANLDFINALTGYTINSLDLKLFKTTNAGINWENIRTLPSFLGGYIMIDFLENGKAVGTASAANYGKIYKTTDEGISWETFELNNSSLVLNAPTWDTCFVVGYGGLIFRSTNFGTNWICQSSQYGNLAPLRKITFTDEQTGFIVGDGGSFFKTTNAGLNWSYSKLSSYNLTTAYFIDNQTGFVGSGNSTKIFKTTTGGNTWDTTSLSAGNFLSINFIDNLTGFAATGIRYYKTTNSGNTWSELNAPASGNLGGMYFVNENIGYSTYYVNSPPFVNQGTLYKTTNGGLNWFSIYVINGGAISYLNFVDENTGYIKDRYVMKTTNGGQSWFSILNGSNCNEVKTMATNTIYSGSYKSTNGGVNWTLFNTKVQSINSVHYINENTGIIVGGNGAGILRTTDGGEIITSVVPISLSETPNTISLHQNYPNPFNPSTKINFDLRNSAFAMLRVYDITGREVKTLVNEKLTAGSYTYDFNASELPSGVYFYQLQTDGFVETKKMILLK